MKLFRQKISIIQIQWIAWIVISTILFCVMVTHDPWLQALAYTTNYIIFYAAIIYGNACLLIPKLYKQKKKTLYVLVVIVSLLLLTWLFVQSQHFIYYTFFSKEEKVMPIPFRSYISIFFSYLMVYIFSIAFRLSMDYFSIQKKQADLEKRTAEAELNLLKAQVQPHFLFNTLNNIYFVAQRESPATAALVERLSNIMRYFTDDGPRAFIPLNHEIAFIKDYIELEKVRMRHPLQVTLNTTGNPENIQLPPMLLIPLVENVFKHGINKRLENNSIEIKIEAGEQQLKVFVTNSLHGESATPQRTGNGLSNLQHRLQLLYGEHFTFNTQKQPNHFTAQLIIPV